MDIKKRILKEAKKRKSFTPEQMAASLRVSVGKLRRPLFELTGARRLTETKDGRLSAAEKLDLVTGTIDTKPGGFAFVRPADGGDDLFIGRNDKNGALNGETVLVRIKRKQPGSGRTEGRVTEVLSPLNATVVGTMAYDGQTVFVKNDLPNEDDVFVPGKKRGGAKRGQKVVVRLTQRGGRNRLPEGEVIEVLGKEGQPGVDILSFARRFGLTAKFEGECESEANGLLRKRTGPKGRLDLRNEVIVTIDGADAKDLDDAVSLKMLESGNQLLGVHIADVSRYVKEGGPLDDEARRRGTSVYMVNEVVPMLPEALSNHLCSLNPGEDKYTLSCLVELNKKGEPVDRRLESSMIRTAHRMTYDDVNKLLGGNRGTAKEYADVTDMLRKMNALAKKLRKRRFERGSIDFDLNEAEITLDEKGFAANVDVRERGDAQKLIEEFMLLANVTVAEHFYRLEIPFVYRIHEQPDTDKMRELAAFLQNFGIKLHGAADIRPKDIQDVLTRVEGTPESNIISTVTLRSLKKARYDVEPVEHFGLAADRYCHFTSPIRRYPDLCVHRIIRLWLDGKLDARRKKRLEKELPGIAAHSSERERNAIEAERAVNDMKAAEYMSLRIGEEFEGVISGVTGFGVFVELENTVEGMVPLGSMEDDYYIYYEKQYCLIGEKTKKRVTLGDKARVRVVSTDIPAGKIEFGFAE